MSVLIAIPARMKATRLPNKPLAMIAGKPMIVHVAASAQASGVGSVIIACDAPEIQQAAALANVPATLTRSDHPSGSDRIWEVAEKTPEYEIIINLQGDVPTLEPRLLRELLEPLANPDVDIATLAAPIMRPEEHENPNVVKVVMALESGKNIGRALYFTRATAPYGDGPRFHHIGVYAYRREALRRFVSLPPSPLETREKLEQLRALEAGMRVDVRVVDTVPLGVDTPEDLARAQELMK